MNQRFLTIADVAETLNLSQSATRALLSSGELPAIQVGGKRTWRIEATELEKYIERQYQLTRERIQAGKA
ncbi:MAG: helix-turn-helix domain-containing protein [Actinomycetaceae bacterium]|nr:helix-turn-helix domain-containing protein [Actinomycetaceae bacterium]